MTTVARGVCLTAFSVALVCGVDAFAAEHQIHSC